MTKNNLNDYREHLIIITNGLREMARGAKRQHYNDNRLLRECYNLIDVDMKPKEDWIKENRDIRKGQHAYLFWDRDDVEIDKRKVVFLYSIEQTILLTN